MRSLALLPLLLLSACAPREQAPAALPLLNCERGFETLSAEIGASPSLKQAPKEPGEPYRFYSAIEGGTSYVVTEPGAPGHPALLKQESVDGRMTNSGCPYGDKAGYEQVVAYLQSLSASRRK
ncbi:hypothetical protein [Phenylobacterium sp.]|uniref:hypothetical protein n=1 Tax=Phenylobacterium sp. TaxID=1871053 RepID=UPI002F956DF1